MKLGIFVAVSMLAVPFAAMGQAGRALYGIIHTADDQPVANARVTVTGVGGSSTTISTRMGEFQFHNLATGSYTVTVAHPSYRLREPVRVIVYEDKRIDLEVELQGIDEVGGARDLVRRAPYRGWRPGARHRAYDTWARGA